MSRRLYLLVIVISMGLMTPLADRAMRAAPPKGASVPAPAAALIPLDAQQALHTWMDHLIEAKAKGQPFAAPSDDSEFFRRVNLDLAGRIPTVERVKAFLKDKSPDKRRKEIDRLLSGPHYVIRMADWFNSMLIERRGEDKQWLAWLRASFKANTPWDQMARKILNPDARDEKTRATAYFITRRLQKVGTQPTDYPGLTRDVGRLMLGVDLQCAQCHNHISIPEYKQIDFQGMFVVYRNINIFRAKFPAVEEKVMSKKIEYVSVFSKGKSRQIGPRLPFGQEILIANYQKKEAYLHAPNKKEQLPGVPKFSAMAQLANRIATGRNRAFARNAVNRLWFMMMGRGIVDPLDQHHSDNPPSHPALLEVLTDQFIAHDFDIKWMLGQLARSRTYQRSGLLPEGADAPAVELFLVGLEKPMSVEQMYYSVLQIFGGFSDLEKEKKEEKLENLRALFVRAMANAPKEPELRPNPSLKSALYLLNDPGFLGLIREVKLGLHGRLTQAEDAADLADELYLGVLSRFPAQTERDEVAQYLMQNKDRKDEAISHLVWALLASAEFGLNH